jgi:hypothetical protein
MIDSCSELTVRTPATSFYEKDSKKTTIWTRDKLQSIQKEEIFSFQNAQTGS